MVYDGLEHCAVEEMKMVLPNQIKCRELEFR